MARTVDRNAKRLQILEAAVGCFAKSGFEATTMDDIAAAAGVSKGSLYDYFKHKDDMFYAVYEWIVEAHLKNMERAGGGPPRQELVAFVESTMAGAFQFIELYPITMEVWAAAGGQSKLRNRFKTALLSFYDSYRGHIAGLIAEAKKAGEIKAKIDAAVFASVLIAVIDGLLLQYWLQQDFDPKKALKVFLNGLFDGIGA